MSGSVPGGGSCSAWMEGHDWVRHEAGGGGGGGGDWWLVGGGR